MRFGEGALVIVHLANPTEKFWGVLERLEPVGVIYRGLSLSVFEEWMIEVARGEQPTLGLATMFVPLFRVERIFLDEQVGEVESYRQRFLRYTMNDTNNIVDRAVIAATAVSDDWHLNVLCTHIQAGLDPTNSAIRTAQLAELDQFATDNDYASGPSAARWEELRTEHRVKARHAANEAELESAIDAMVAQQPLIKPLVTSNRAVVVSGHPLASRAGALALSALGGPPFAALDGVKQLLLVSIKFHRRTPHRGIASSPSGSG